MITHKGKASLAEVAQAVNQSRGHTHGRLQDLVEAGLVTRLEEWQHVFYVQPSFQVVPDNSERGAG